MSSRGVVRLLAVVALAAALVGCGQDERTSGSADAVVAPTRCVGTIGAEDVAGDLLVPDGRDCRLVGTAVAGRTVVGEGATLRARSAYLGQGLRADGFDRVELVGGAVPGRSRHWRAGLDELGEGPEVPYLFRSGGSALVLDGSGNGHYRFVGNRGRVEVRGLYLDLGTLRCRANRVRPEVRGISAETPGKLQGQCAGRRGFGGTDF